MESDVGKCWTCGRRSAFKCHECRFAAYCSSECQESDRKRHRAECRVSVKAQCCNNNKCNSRSSLARCCSCRYAFYCRRCMPLMSAVGTHESDCGIATDAAVDAAVLDKLTPPRLWTSLAGHAQAEDYLRLRQNEGRDSERHLRLLFLGVGYMRDVIRTVTDVPSEFRGQLFFVLNDISRHVIARDLLFLYCAIVHPEVDHLVQIWYSVFLLPECLVYLVKMLKELVRDPREVILGKMHGLVEVNDRHWKKCIKIWKVMHKEALDPDAAEKMAEIRWKMTEVAVPYRQEVVMEVLRVPDKHHQSVMDLLDNGLLLPMNDSKRKLAVFPNSTMVDNGYRSFSKQADQDTAESSKSDKATQEDGAGDKCDKLQRRKLPSLRFSRQHGRAVSNRSYFDDAVALSALTNLPDQLPKKDVFTRLVLETSCIFHCWDYRTVQETMCGKSDDLLDMYRSYLTIVFQSFVDKLATGKVKFHLVICHCMNMEKYIPPTDKFDRIRVTNLSDYFTYPLFLEHFGHHLNRDNNHSVLITLHERWVMGTSFCYTATCSTYPKLAARLLSAHSEYRNVDWTLSYREEYPYSDVALMFYRSLLADYICYSKDNTSCSTTASISSQVDLFIANLMPPEDVATVFGLHLRNYNTRLNRVVPFRRDRRGRIQACNGKCYLEWTWSAPATDDN